MGQDMDRKQEAERYPVVHAGEKCTAIVLAAGRGTRMQSSIPKQYLLLKGKPALYYSLKVFQESFVDKIILVASENDMEHCRHDIVRRFGFDKVAAVVAGGKERYHSVQRGLKAAGECDYIFIHDGARPFVTADILGRAYACVREHGACVAGMPVKDTIKIADEHGFALSTPRRDRVWMVQTPQAFSGNLIRDAYSALAEKEEELVRQGVRITDDAMVVETFTDVKVKLVEGSYENIKITTPEDLQVAESFFTKGVRL